MNYIIIDLEWNQPYSRAGMIMRPVPLIGEVIRIGAVKLDDDLNEISRYHGFVRPRFYKKMNSAVGRVTGLKNASVKQGRTFPEEFAAFMEWCREGADSPDDITLLAWGGEDEKVMNINILAHETDRHGMPQFYDLQKIFTMRVTLDGKQYGVRSALEYYGLPAELQAHDALNDAVYTARIGKCMDFPKYLPEYGAMLEEEEKRRSRKLVRSYGGFASLEEALSSRKVLVCKCPVCRRFMKREKYVHSKENELLSIAYCPDEGDFSVKIRVNLCADGRYSATRYIKPLTPEFRENYSQALSGNETGSVSADETSSE